MPGRQAYVAPLRYDYQWIMRSGNTLEQIAQALADYDPKRLDLPTTTPAAVLILLHEWSGQPHIVFTERTEHVEHHKGQISFPGGAYDEEDETLDRTALRETFEEIGVQPEHVNIIGQLDDLVTVSNFRVTPYVGVLASQSDYPFVPNGHEVAQMVHVPVTWLLDEQNMELEVREHMGREVLVPAFSYQGHYIWGATARMLHHFIEIIR